jgi:sugar O-acyltransferase (sialic acid O-acetyltransferase NeuD family)
MRRAIFILGSGGFARELYGYLCALHHFPRSAADPDRINRPVLDNEIFFVDDNNAGRNNVISSSEYYSRIANNSAPESYTMIGSGKSDIRLRMLKQARGKIMSLVHPAAHVFAKKLGEGLIVAPGAVIAPNVTLGKHVLCNYNATIGHDSVIEDMVVIGPNAAIGGGVTIESGVYIGAGATIKEGITIGKNSVVGMGAAVVKSVPPNLTVVGVPAKVISNKKGDEI